jgi:hypothetical protein
MADPRLGDGLDRIVNPQVGLIAVFALLLSIFNTTYQVLQLARRSDPKLLKPEQILVVPDKYPTGHIFVRFGVGLSYVNLGPAQKSVVVEKESLSYTMLDRSYTQQWHSFESFGGRACELSSTESKDVHPVVLSGSDATSHVTYFAPRVVPRGADPYVNFHSLGQFLEGIKKKALTLNLRSEMLGRESLNQTCRIMVTEYESTLLAQGCAVTLSCE